MKPKTPRMGRPPIARSEHRNKRVFVNMTGAELAQVKAAAKRKGFKTLSDFFMHPWR